MMLPEDIKIYPQKVKIVTIHKTDQCYNMKEKLLGKTGNFKVEAIYTNEAGFVSGVFIPDDEVIEYFLQAVKVKLV